MSIIDPEGDETIESNLGMFIPNTNFTAGDSRKLANWLEGMADAFRFYAIDKTDTEPCTVEAKISNRDMRTMMDLWRANGRPG
jgi:hypothetical protein